MKIIRQKDKWIEFETIVIEQIYFRKALSEYPKAEFYEEEQE